jgi:hypothetical protein
VAAVRMNSIIISEVYCIQTFHLRVCYSALPSRSEQQRHRSHFETLQGLTSTPICNVFISKINEDRLKYDRRIAKYKFVEYVYSSMKYNSWLLFYSTVNSP